jgi:hypothetical protein
MNRYALFWESVTLTLGSRPLPVHGCSGLRQPKIRMIALPLTTSIWHISGWSGRMSTDWGFTQVELETLEMSDTAPACAAGSPGRTTRAAAAENKSRERRATAVEDARAGRPLAFIIGERCSAYFPGFG